MRRSSISITARPVGEEFSTSKSLENPITSSQWKGDGKVREDEFEDEIGSVFSSDTVGTWVIQKETKSNAKMESDHKKFMEWFHDVVSKHLLRIRDDWEDIVHDTLVEQGEEDFRQILERIINNMTFKHDFERKRLLHVLDESTGWTYIELWWMIVLCFEEKVVRGTYGTPKQGEGKEIDREMGERAAKGSLISLRRRLINGWKKIWIVKTRITPNK
jgi:hypothetical protein